MTFGVYYDRYVVEGDRWRFQSRHWSLHYRGPMDLSAPLVEFPDYGRTRPCRPPTSRRSRAGLRRFPRPFAHIQFSTAFAQVGSELGRPALGPLARNGVNSPVTQNRHRNSMSPSIAPISTTTWANP